MAYSASSGTINVKFLNGTSTTIELPDNFKTFLTEVKRKYLQLNPSRPKNCALKIIDSSINKEITQENYVSNKKRILRLCCLFAIEKIAQTTKESLHSEEKSEESTEEHSNFDYTLKFPSGEQILLNTSLAWEDLKAILNVICQGQFWTLIIDSKKYTSQNYDEYKQALAKLKESNKTLVSPNAYVHIIIEKPKNNLESLAAAAPAPAPAPSAPDQDPADKKEKDSNLPPEDEGPGIVLATSTPSSSATPSAPDADKKDPNCGAGQAGAGSAEAAAATGRNSTNTYRLSTNITDEELDTIQLTTNLSHHKFIDQLNSTAEAIAKAYSKKKNIEFTWTDWSITTREGSSYNKSFFNNPSQYEEMRATFEHKIKALQKLSSNIPQLAAFSVKMQEKNFSPLKDALRAYIPHGVLHFMYNRNHTQAVKDTLKEIEKNKNRIRTLEGAATVLKEHLKKNISPTGFLFRTVIQPFLLDTTPFKPLSPPPATPMHETLAAAAAPAPTPSAPDPDETTQKAPSSDVDNSL